MATPKLRFNEFNEKWEEKKLGKICQHFKSGKSITSKYITDTGDYPVYGGNGLRGFTTNFTHDGKFILIGRQGALCGNVQLASGKNYISEHAIAVQADQKNSTDWLAYWLDNMKLNRFSESSAQPGLAVNKLIKFKIKLPTKAEQTKIATFLSAVDTKIDELTQKHELLTDYKKGMMQQLFSQKLRFKADDGSDFEDWIKYNIGAIFTEIKDQVLDQDIETYSITAGKGFISQAEKFGRDISGNQNRKYIVLKPNDFSYNKGNSKTFKYGCVYLNRFNHNIAVPNVFISFRTKESNKHYSIFYAQLFESHYLDKHLRLLISSSARMDGLLNISKKGFFEIPIPSPCLEEQTKIANFLTAIDQKIDNVAEQIDHAKTWKKGLLQQMFV